MSNVPSAPPSPPGDACLGCGDSVVSSGVVPFRIGGTSGGAQLLFGRLAELGEEMLNMEVLTCQRCRRVELRLPPA
jgi:hypothetical protein